MDEIFNWLRHHVSGEVAVVTGAPGLFAMAVFLSGCVLFVLIRGHFAERIETLQATVDHKQSVLDEYKDRLKGATPAEVEKQLSALKETVDRLGAIVNRPQRRLTHEQIHKLKTGVANLANKHEIWANPLFRLGLSSTPDTECARFCTQLFEALKFSGVRCDMNTLGMHEEGESGIIFYCPDFEQNPWFAQLADLFSDVGLKPDRRKDPHNDQQIYIFVSPEEVT